jgi:hypothetical protein
MLHANSYFLDEAALDRLKRFIGQYTAVGFNNQPTDFATDLGPPQPIYLGVTASTITAMSGTTPGSGPVNIYTLQDNATNGNLAWQQATVDQVTAYSLATGTIPSGTTVNLIRDPLSGYYVIVSGVGSPGTGNTVGVVTGFQCASGGVRQYNYQQLSSYVMIGGVKFPVVHTLS